MRLIKHALLLINTLKYLKFRQLFFFLIYKIFPSKRVSFSCDGRFLELSLVPLPARSILMYVEGDFWTFKFLNLARKYHKFDVDWSDLRNGLLWTYNLNYFDWLHQSGMTKELGLGTLNHFFSKSKTNNPIILHPYPTSLRIINVAKFISRWNIKENWLYNEMVSDLGFLNRRLEFHLLANHLIENAFALYIGGLITNQSEFIQKGKKLLVRELNEQVLNDGMHFERSPMYHLIILERLLDALNFAKASGDDFESTLKSYAVRMTGVVMNWEDLDRIPKMQDSAYDVTLTVPVILDYSKCLLGNEYPTVANDLKDSGYRKLKNEYFELYLNIGEIRPSYQPGHAHADELNFELFYQGRPVIVDTGVSTYEKNERRLLERSTVSHNCLVINSLNSSDVWSGFRVGKRAKVEVLQENDKIVAQHFGYNPLVVRRTWEIVNGLIVIGDELINTPKIFDAKGKLHFHPDLKLLQIDKCSYMLSNNLVVEFESQSGDVDVSMGRYEYAKGYNVTSEALELIYKCTDKMKIIIYEAD